MKQIKQTLVAAVVALAASGLSAACLSDYNTALYGCESTGFGFFTRQGCRADALIGYYACILDQATG